MNVHVSELNRQAKHYEQVRARILNAAPAPAQCDRYDDLERRIAELRRQLKSMRDERDHALTAANVAKSMLITAKAKIADQDRIISELAGEPERRTPEQIAAEVLEDFPNASWDEVLGGNCATRLTKPRRLCMVAIKKERDDLSYATVGRIFNRDRTSVYHAMKKEGLWEVGAQ